MATAQFFQPDIQADQAAIERNRLLAERLQKQSEEPAPGAGMAGRVFVGNSWTQGLAKLLQGYNAGKARDTADDQTRKLAALLQKKNTDDMSGFMEAMQGKPAQSFQTGANEMGDDAATQNVAAQGPDRMRAIQIALQSQNPMLQQQGGNMLSKQLEMQQIMAALGGQPGQAGGVVGSGIGQVSPQAVALAAMGGNGAKIGEMIQSAQKPIALREGDLVVGDGQGGARSAYSQPKLAPNMQPVRGPGGEVIGAQAIPGAPQAVATLGAAQEKPKAEADMVTVNTPNGPVMMTRAQAAAQASGSGYNGGSQAAANAETVKMMQTEADRLGPNHPDTPSILRSIARLRQQTPGIPLQDDASKVLGEQRARNQAEREQAQPQEQFAITSALDQVNNALKQISHLRNNETGIDRITGTLMSRLPNISAASGNAQSDLDTLKNQISVQVLNAMRAASKTGGAAGSVSEKEWPIFQSQMGSLQQAQSKQQFMDRLKDVEDTLLRVSSAYKTKQNMAYPNGGTNSGGWGIQKVN